MKKDLRIIYFVILLLVIVLEALPFGAVLNFAPSPTDTIRETYSYFSLNPFGYANFGPFITALITSVLLIVSLLLLFVNNQKLKNILFICSLVSTVTSLLPLMFGIAYFSIVGCCISILLLIAVVISYKIKQ